jgi:hypothetical protein
MKAVTWIAGKAQWITFVVIEKVLELFGVYAYFVPAGPRWGFFELERSEPDEKGTREYWVLGMNSYISFKPWLRKLLGYA